MHGSARSEASTDDAVLAIIEPLRRILAAQAGDAHTLDDTVQETLARVVAARPRLDDAALLPFAVVTGRNHLASAARGRARAGRYAHLLAEGRSPETPEQSLLRREREGAVHAGLRALPRRDRDLLVAHEVHGADTASLAAERASTPGAVAAQLARARARMRVDFVLALRGERLPTPQCRRVLLALSAGDRRRQRALGAGDHLLACETCNRLAEPLVARRSVLAGMLPLTLLTGTAPSGSAQRLRETRLRVSTALAALAAVLSVAALLLPQERPAPGSSGPTPRAGAPTGTSAGAPSGTSAGARAPARGPSPAAPTTGPDVAGETGPVSLGRTGDPGAGELAGRLRGLVGRAVQARDVRVLEVAADEGFWVGTGPRDRVWVQLSGAGESPVQVRPGARVSFTGTVTANPDGFGAREVEADEGAAQLDAHGAHVRVPVAELTVD